MVFAVRTKENTEVAVVADLESADRMISHSSRPPPQPPAASMLISGGTSVTLSVTTKKPLYSSPFYTSYSESNSPLFLVSSSSSSSSASSASEDEPHFDAIISYDTSPSDPCYNFTIGNARLREFYSPNYPFNYPNATECERVIIGSYGRLDGSISTNHFSPLQRPMAIKFESNFGTSFTWRTRPTVNTIIWRSVMELMDIRTNWRNSVAETFLAMLPQTIVTSFYASFQMLVLSILAFGPCTPTLKCQVSAHRTEIRSKKI